MALTKIKSTGIAPGTITTENLEFASTDQGNISFEGAIRANLPFYLNPTSIDYDYTVGSNTNAMSVGPITVSANVTVTVSDGSSWTVV